MEDKKKLVDKTKVVTQPSILRSINVTHQHYADLKSLEHNGTYITHETPNSVRKYFKGIALKFELFDAALKSDVNDINKITFTDFRRGYKKNVGLWKVGLVDGQKILVTKKHRVADNKVLVTVEQDVDVFSGNKDDVGLGSSQFFVKQMCPFCKKRVNNLDTHLTAPCVRNVSVIL